MSANHEKGWNIPPPHDTVANDSQAAPCGKVLIVHP